MTTGIRAAAARAAGEDSLRTAKVTVGTKERIGEFGVFLGLTSQLSLPLHFRALPSTVLYQAHRFRFVSHIGHLLRHKGSAIWFRSSELNSAPA